MIARSLAALIGATLLVGGNAATNGPLSLDLGADAPTRVAEPWRVPAYPAPVATRQPVTSIGTNAAPSPPARSSVASRASRSRSTGPNWTALAECESSGNPRAVSPGGLYRGLYQFDLQTWRSVGGVGDPASASPDEQTLRASLLFAARGRQPWPVCGGRL
jgi:hypothetical protein